MGTIFDRDIQQKIQSGNRQVLAKAITNLENSNTEIEIPNFTTSTQVLGITGAPGVGKSTTVDAIIKFLRQKDLSVAVLAVDPSSPISGGALLGDRIRLSDHFTDPKVFIRSIATRGHLGGLSATIKQILNLIHLANFDFIIIETVGVGQSEVEIMRVANTVCVVLAPGMGDGIQAAKAGLLEIGDIYLVNKSDREGALETKQDIEKSIALSMLKTTKGVNWTPPVLLGAMQTGIGIIELMLEVTKHRKAQGIES
jgi:LAO/AO transport system kinase